MILNQSIKLKITKTLLWIFGILGFFWWPLSHWLYPDWYHNLLGFENYDKGMIKVIGTLSFIPMLLAFLSAFDPVKNKVSIITLIVTGFLMTATYIYLIISRQFPVPEYFNAALTAILSIILIIFYPWRYKS